MRFYLAMATRMPALAALLCLATGCATTTSGTALPPSQLPPTPGTLPALLLPADQVGETVGAANLVVTREVTTPWNDGAHFSDVPAGCLAVAGAAQQAEYAGTGWSALHGRVLREPPASPSWSHFAVQAVVLFPTAQAAGDFFAASRRRWESCSNRELTYAQQLSPPQQWTVGPVSDERDLLAVSRVERAPQQWACQRALTVHENVAVDVEACSMAGPTTAAASIARAIAGRIGPA